MVISGATSGIGLALAKEFARRGHSLVIIGLFESELEETKKLLLEEENVGEVLTICTDFSDASTENFERLREKLDPDNREIGILINNVGMMPRIAKRFHKYELGLLSSIVNVNQLAGVHLTRTILPSMIERGRGLVVNVSSAMSSCSGAFFGLYIPTKNFVNAFARQLELEFCRHQVDFVLLSPGPVHTNIMVKDEPGRPYVVEADTFARSVVNALSARPARFCGLYYHELFAILTQCIILPTWLAASTLEFTFRNLSMPLEVSPPMQRRQKKKGEQASENTRANLSSNV